MQSAEIVHKITEYFSATGKKYSTAITDELTRITSNIDEANLDRLWEHLRDNNKASFMVSVSEIVEACRILQIPYHKASAYIPAESWTCDACGHIFKYSVASTDDDMLDKHIFRRCPRCGFFPHETKVLEAYGGRQKAPTRLVKEYQIRVDLCLTRLQAEGKYWNEAKAMTDRKAEPRKYAGMEAVIPDKRMPYPTDSLT